MSPVLHTERLILRAPDARDQAAYCAFAATEDARFIGGPMSEKAARISWGTEIAHWSMHGYGRSAVVPKGKDVAVGLIGPQPPMCCPEHETHWCLFTQAQGL